MVEFRRRTLLPLDDVLGQRRATVPQLSRSALHRCLQRHGISRLPRSDEDASKRGRFTETAIGYVHIEPANAADRPISDAMERSWIVVSPRPILIAG